MATMHAIRFHNYGGPEELRLDIIELPAPRAGQVLVRVRAVGGKPAD